jgi:hypothetical protein
MKNNIRLLIAISICIFQSSAIADSANENAKASRNEQIAEHLVKLQDPRLEALLNKPGRPISESLMNCVCREAGGCGVGGGAYYVAGKGCECVGVLGGHFEPNRPRDTQVLSRICKGSDGHTVVDIISNDIENLSARANEVAGGTVGLSILATREKKLFDRNMRYKLACLPTMPNNHEDELWNLQEGVINKVVPMLNARSKIMEETIDIVESSENICEESIRVSLYLNSQQGRTTFENLKDIIYPWLPPYINFDNISITESIIGAPPILSSASNLKSNIELLSSEYAIRKANTQFREAYELFNESKSWSVTKLEGHETNLQKDINSIQMEINKINSDLDDLLLRAKPDSGPRYQPGTKNPHVPNKDEWDEYDEKTRKPIQLANSRIGVLLHEKTGLLIKKNVIHRYRRPLNQKGGCEKFLEEIKKECNK